MKIVENTIALIAPHRCIICAESGEPLCTNCRLSSLASFPSRCYRCHGVSERHAVCKSCKSSVKLNRVWIATEYEGPAKELIHKFKFERAKAAYKSVAAAIDDVLPDLPRETIVCHVPTAKQRVRKRGYDQAKLIAGELANLSGLKHKTLLVRHGSSRQVGSSRKERFAHLEKALQIKNESDVAGQYILLVDDVTTTGATIEAAAKILKQAGAHVINAAVFAQPA